MASDKNQLQFVIEQMAAAGTLSAKSMFGEYGIYCDGKIVALFCDNQLFVKPTLAGRAFAKHVAEAPPYPGAKMYLLVEDQIDDSEWLSELIRRTAQELPDPATRPKKASKTAKSSSKTLSSEKPKAGQLKGRKTTAPARTGKAALKKRK